MVSTVVARFCCDHKWIDLPRAAGHPIFQEMDQSSRLNRKSDPNRYDCSSGNSDLLVSVGRKSPGLVLACSDPLTCLDFLIHVEVRISAFRRTRWACDSPDCGRSPLYSSRQREIFSLALAKLRNQLAFKHSSRNRPLKLFTWPFCLGRPG